jgi:anti-sigma regulatory factor (Ser/Thr protein kinase)
VTVPEPLGGGTAWFTFDTATSAAPHWSWRRELVELLHEVPAAAWSADDVVVVAGELVANAIEHGGGARRLHVFGTPRGVLVEVTDDADHEPAPRGGTDLGDDRGRGFLIVGALADRWGWRRDPKGGKCVWASIGDPLSVGDVA